MCMNMWVFSELCFFVNVLRLSMKCRLWLLVSRIIFVFRLIRVFKLVRRFRLFGFLLR